MTHRILLAISILATLAVADAHAQTPGPVRLRLVSQRRIGGMDEPRTVGLTGANRQNGRNYRFRESFPHDLPEYVEREVDYLPLAIADSTADGWLAFYRSPPGRFDARNASFEVVLHGVGGEQRWKRVLNDHLSRPDHLEITDVRYADGKLYFNESCQSYSREAAGRCSSLVRIDPATNRVEWRTRPLVSNGIFILHGPWVITGYGFTAEPDSVFVIDRETGRVLATAPVDKMPDYLEVKDGRLYVTTLHSLYVFDLATDGRTGRMGR
jgi:hypothetical protein